VKSMCCALLCAALMPASSARVCAQAQPTQLGVEWVRVRVLATNGEAVQIDRGREAGVEPGDRVRFQPLGDREQWGRVLSVAERSSWVNLFDAQVRLDLSTPGEVEIPVARRRRDDGESGNGGYRDRSGPLPEEDVPWAKARGPADIGTPLLEQLGTRPQDRAAQWRGRVWFSMFAAAEREFRDSQSVFARTGLDLSGENPLGHGGTVHLRLETDFRSFDAEGEAADREAAVRLERASYRLGGNRHAEQRIEFGRFLQAGFPELGLLDGMEMQWGRADAARIGWSAGWLPEATQELTTGNDLQVAVYYRDQRGGTQLADRRMRWGAAVQQTWNDGQADRSLLLLQADWMQGGFAWRNAAWIDFYDADDVGKSSGAEPTLVYSLANWSTPDGGWSAGARHWRFPSLLRFQAGRFTVLDLFDGQTTRFDLSAWRRVRPGLRLRVRLDHWQDQDQDGQGWEARGDFDDLWLDQTRSSLTLFQHQGSFTDLLGVRLSQGLPVSNGLWSAEWESVRYDERFSTDSSLEHEARLRWSWRSSGAWNFQGDFAWRFGDEQDSPSLSFYATRSF